MQTNGEFWAGGGREGWFVRFKFTEKDERSAPQIAWFDARDYSGELAAALAAEKLADTLNAALKVANPSPDLTTLNDADLCAEAERNRSTERSDAIHAELRARRMWLEWNDQGHVTAWGHD